MTSQVEEAGDGRGVRLHDARLEVCRRAHHADGVDSREAAKRPSFVLDAVLQARQCEARGCHGFQRSERVVRVLALGRQEHHIVVAKRQLRRLLDDGNGKRDGSRGGLDAKSLPPDRPRVIAASDEHHVVAVLEETPAYDAADRTRPVDEEAHAYCANSRRFS